MRLEDEFFVGYLPVPPSFKRRLRLIVVLLCGMAAVAGSVIAVAQHGYAHSTFEFGDYRSFEGVVLENPYPMLLILRPGHTSPSESFSSYLLVDQFKHGAGGQIQGLDGRYVRLRAALIYRAEGIMLELRPGSVEVIPHNSLPEHVMQSLGPITLRGELVDSKCYLGVMNPGHGKVHRDCAARCVSGGVPVAVVSINTHEHNSIFYVVSENRQRQEQLLSHVGEVITMSGQAVRVGEQLFVLERGGKL